MNWNELKKDKKYDLLVLLSGPEPQRTIFENLILKQLVHSTLRILIVRGKPGSLRRLDVKENIEI